MRELTPPLIYHQIVYGPQVEHRDTSPPIDQLRLKRIQQIIGVFLYYARAVDESMLCALNKLASRQVNPTEELERDVDRFLQYAATYPNGKTDFLALWPYIVCPFGCLLCLRNQLSISSWRFLLSGLATHQWEQPNQRRIKILVQNHAKRSLLGS